MGKYDYRDPGQDPAYCDGLRPDPNDEPIEETDERPDPPPPTDEDVPADVETSRADLTIRYDLGEAQAGRLRIRAETAAGIAWLAGWRPHHPDTFVHGWTLHAPITDGLAAVVDARKAGLHIPERPFPLGDLPRPLRKDCP